MRNIIHFETLGCRLNQDESEVAAKKFSDAGFVCSMEGVTSAAAVNEDVLLCIVNTCTVTAKAEQKARRIIRLLLEKYPLAPVIVTGCYAQLDGPFIEQMDFSRIVILSGNKKELLSDLAEELKSCKSISKDELKLFIQKKSAAKKENAFLLYTPVFEKHSRASIKIQDGCNNACTFCRIHLARGKSVSLEPEEVLRRVQELEARGTGEVVFTGVNLSQYSCQDKNGSLLDFTQLLEYLLCSTQKIKFRISSFYPQHITDRLCKFLADPRIQPSFHLSVQSGSDEILKKMARPYRAEDVVKAVNLLRSAKKNPFIGCDMIAGFPGESEEDFNLTTELCKSVSFSWIHAFPFSPRPGTPAFSMGGQIPSSVKGQRVKVLTSLAVQGKIDYINSCKGQVFPAVCENSRKDRLASTGLSNHASTSLSKRTSTESVHAVTSNFLHCKCLLPNGLALPAPGSTVNVMIKEPLEKSILDGEEEECLAEILL
ncbi:MAG: tRNA (N(6)-L-threonylcarbamoyladenosine(37)-C(2))-methylthiotransferase MtaB [Treponema sp.]|nr:tRNA (N(6)-L-threonylcarbamoyladenosine(37)-C(2))-methylthiotransferase MtaB [Treponema sp.]